MRDFELINKNDKKEEKLLKERYSFEKNKSFYFVFHPKKR